MPLADTLGQAHSDGRDRNVETPHRAREEKNCNLERAYYEKTSTIQPRAAMRRRTRRRFNAPRPSGNLITATTMPPTERGRVITISLDVQFNAGCIYSLEGMEG
jgi:hypothetical protein